MKEWLKIFIRHKDKKEVLSLKLWELGVLGIEENEDGLITYIEPQKWKEFKNFLKSIFIKLPVIETETIKEEKWHEKHKAFFKAQSISKLFYIVPVWDKETIIPKNFIPIKMELGQAFGTGLHSSTRLAIKLIEKVYKLNHLSFLDIGTGSGILSIVAYKLGFRKIFAVDNDEIALKEAVINFRNNNCKNIRLFSSLPKTRKFDVIASNILFNTHMELSNYYNEILKGGGELILSGMLASETTQLKKKFIELGFILEEVEYSGEWSSILLIKRNS